MASDPVRATPSNVMSPRSRLEAQNFALNLFDIIAETDRRGRITFVNDRFCEISKYSREELIGQDHRIINSGYHPKEFFRELWTTINKGQVWSGEIRNRAKDGTLYWVNTMISPFMNDQHEIVGFVSIRREITRQKQFEEALRQSELRYRELLNNAGLLALGLDLQGNITFGNRALFEALGKDSHQVLGMDWFNHFIPKEALPVATHIFEETLTRENFPKEHEQEIVGRNGERRLVLWRNTLLRDSQGNILGITALGEDITKKREDQLKLEVLKRKAEAQREEIMSFVSHEVRSPLMSIRAGIDHIREALSDSKGENYLQTLARMESQIERIDRISRDLLLSSALSNDELSITRSPVDLKVLLNRLADRFSLDLHPRSLKLELSLPDQPLMIEGDESRLDQAFSNLLSNAIKYSKPSGGLIRVSAAVEEDAMTISVSDEGVGIPETHLPHIFEKFRRAENAEAAHIPGFGLGLNIARDIIRKHEGEIWVRSKENEGSQFFVKFKKRT